MKVYELPEMQHRFFTLGLKEEKFQFTVDLSDWQTITVKATGSDCPKIKINPTSDVEDLADLLEELALKLRQWQAEAE